MGLATGRLPLRIPQRGYLRRATLAVAEPSRIRLLTEQIRVLVSHDLQVVATQGKHHAYAVRETADGSADKRLPDYPGTTPQGRVRDALQQFYRAARTDLGVRSPNDVARDEVLPSDPWS